MPITRQRDAPGTARPQHHMLAPIAQITAAHTTRRRLGNTKRSKVKPVEMTNHSITISHSSLEQERANSDWSCALSSVPLVPARNTKTGAQKWVSSVSRTARAKRWIRHRILHVAGQEKIADMSIAMITMTSPRSASIALRR